MNYVYFHVKPLNTKNEVKSEPIQVKEVKTWDEMSTAEHIIFGSLGCGIIFTGSLILIAIMAAIGKSLKNTLRHWYRSRF